MSDELKRMRALANMVIERPGGFTLATSHGYDLLHLCIEVARLREERDSQQRVCIEVMAERDALRADAGRYRWLKTNARRIDFAGLSWTQGCELDDRVDAALREGK